MNSPNFSSSPPRQRPNVDIPTPQDTERDLRAYGLFVYWVNSRGHHIALQRSLVLTVKDRQVVEEELKQLVSDIERLANEIDGKDRSYGFEIFEVGDDTVETHPPFDSVVKAVTRPFVLGRRSPETHNVYRDVTARYCLHTQANIQFFITTSRPD